MRRKALLLLGLLIAGVSTQLDKYVDDCDTALESCENLAENAMWQRKALFGMLHPQYLADVLAEIDAAKEDGNLLAAMAFWDLEPYQDAIEGEFNDFHPKMFKSKPFAVFADGEGGGMVLYKSGFGYRLGSQIGGGLISRITSDSMTITKTASGEDEIIQFTGLYLAGRMVDEKGLGFSRLPPLSADKILKGWKRKE